MTPLLRHSELPDDDDEFVVTSEAIDPASFAEFKRLLALDVREGFRLDMEDA